MSKAQKKTSKRAPVTKKSAAHVPKPAVQRRDGSGHVDPAHAARLLELGRETHEDDSERAFVSKSRAREPLAEELGEGAVTNMTAGEDSLPDTLDEKVDEEDGGPFVETSGSEEFAQGTDESNIAGATREPFPRTSGGSR